MTKKEFKAALRKGLGRCVAAVERDPEKYRDIVLWACRQNIAYDAQSEGTRAWLVYTLANRYEDVMPFVAASAEAMRRCRSDGGWDMSHLSELLIRFSLDGYSLAAGALNDKYQELLASLMGRKRRKHPVFHELEDLERLCVEIAVDSESCLRIAADLGRLYREKNYMDEWDFAWFFAHIGKRYDRLLANQAERSEDVAAFLSWKRAFEEAEQNLKRSPAPPKSGRALEIWKARRADKDTLAQYAADYRAETEPEKRAQALRVFRWRVYPDDPGPIIADTGSGCEALSDTAWRVLRDIRHPAVRSFSLANAEDGLCSDRNITLLARNYEHRDRELLERQVHRLINTGDADALHAAYLGILAVFDDKSGLPRPRHLLPVIYETNPCSFCRESTLRFMGKHRMLTMDILNECLYDCSDHIRRYGAQCLKRRKKL